MTAANTQDCFREFVGQKLIGLLFDAMPSKDASLRSGNRHLIFEDGRALTLSNNGSYWIDSAKDVQRAVALKEKELAQNEREIREVLELAAVSGAA